MMAWILTIKLFLNANLLKRVNKLWKKNEGILNNPTKPYAVLNNLNDNQ